jgi:pantothenate kinase
MPVTEGSEPEQELGAPGFDHAVGDPVPDAIIIKSTCRALVVEGNYTLLSQEPWNEIANLAEEKYVVTFGSWLHNWFICVIDADILYHAKMVRRHSQ